MLNWTAKTGDKSYRFKKERMDVSYEQEKTPHPAVDLCAGDCSVWQSSGKSLQHQFLGNQGLPHRIRDR